MSAARYRESSDYVIVGAGPAGCVMAARLSEDPDVTVTLLEAGGSDRHPLIHVPAGFARMTKGIASWGWSTVPQRHLNGRVLWYTQAKVLGGGSSINAQIYTRGHPADYDGWAQDGCEGWSYREVLPYFKRAEDNQRLDDDHHSRGGPLGVSDPIAPLPICEAWFEAAGTLGIPFNADFNGTRQEGVGYYQLTQRDARRSSAATAYLGAARGRRNLAVRTEVRVLRILTVRLASSDPAAAPLIDPNYWAEPNDRAMAFRGLRLAREMMRQDALKPFVAREALPGPEVECDEALFDYACASAKTDHHPVGTCRMGTDDMAVVGPDLRVRGIAGLRVADSSVMPRVPSCNTNAPTIMVGEKASDLILGRESLPPAVFKGNEPRFVEDR